MFSYQLHIKIILLSSFIFFTGCTIPKRIQLSDTLGFKSNCSIIKSAAVLRHKDYAYRELKTANLLIEHPKWRKLPESIIGLYSKIKPGTQVNIGKVETMWDFENGDRIRISGSISQNSQTTPFVFEGFFTSESESIDFFKRTFKPC